MDITQKRGKKGEKKGDKVNKIFRPPTVWNITAFRLKFFDTGILIKQLSIFREKSNRVSFFSILVHFFRKI